MTRKTILCLSAILLILFSGCRTKDDLVLFRPGDVPVWRTVQLPSADEVDRPQVEIETSMGGFVVELFESESPITVANFLRYVEDGFYDGLIFHRVIPGFMVQGGGFNREMEEQPTRDAIRNEAGNGLRNTRGTLAMARTDDIDSATAQFFVNLTDNPFLNGDGESGGYAVFGRVVSGMSVVDAMADVDTDTVNGHGDVPVEPILIVNVRRID
ncbi:MAG: peptidyl-prolyl cis-trans isomerase [Opitutales bacterium]|nr:peptidyl-prolyl cis-trans isomerase [Opitutales bacterium]